MDDDDDPSAGDIEVDGDTQLGDSDTLWSNEIGSLFEREPESERLSHYVLLSRVGQGGMGIVYAAFDERLERKVAIKLLRSPDRPDAQRRLVREAQAMARLSHPNVVQIYEINQLDDSVFIVMEFVNGLTLRKWLEAEPRSQREILDVFIAAGRGLEAAHAHRLVHRDFKPDNVMLRRDGRVLVMDFGLAHQSATDVSRMTVARARADAQPIDLTLTGQLMGTPAYMAPEQFNSMPTDARTDQFSFSVALWEALHGQRPFAATTLAELANAVTAGIYAKVESSDVPPWLRKVLRRGLAVEPDDRWPSMAAMLDALAKDPTRRRRALGLGLGAVALVLGAVAAAQLGQARARERAVAACERAGQGLAEDWSESVQAELGRAFTATGLELGPEAWRRTQAWMDDYAQQWSSARVEVCLAATVEHRVDEAEYAVASACLAERRATFNGLLAAWAEPDAATVARATVAATQLPPISTCTSDSALALRMAAPTELDAVVSGLRAELERGAALAYAGKYEDGLHAAEAVLASSEELGWTPLIAEALLALGRMQQDLGQSEDARASVRRAYLEATGVGYDRIALEACVSLTWISLRTSSFDQALLWGDVGAALIRRLQLEDDLQEAALLNNVALVLRSQGELERALASQQRALAIREAVLGPSHPGVATSLNNLGAVLWGLGRLDEAIAAHQRALDISAATFGTEHRLVVSALANIGNVYYAQGKFDEAIAAHREALRIRERLLGPDHPDCAKSHNNIGFMLTAKGDHRAAVESFERAVELYAADGGPRQRSVANARSGLGQALHELGDDARARVELDDALAVQRQLDAAASELAETRFALARVRWAQGELEAAHTLATAARADYEEAGAGSEAERERVEAWLREHPLPSE